MSHSVAVKLTLPRRLLLLAAIPLAGLLVLGGLSFRGLDSEYKAFVQDNQTMAAFQQEVSELNAFTEPLARERDAALAVYAHRGDAQYLADYHARCAATDQAVAGLMNKLDQLTSSPQKKFFTEKAQTIRTLLRTMLPEARANTEGAKGSSGKTFSNYLKLAFGRMLITECYRPMLYTPEGLNVFDALFALVKIQQQEVLVISLVLHGSANGGLPKEEMAILRKQFFAITESEYYVRKFQPVIRAFWEDTARKSTDDAAFYQYLTLLAGTQMDNTPLLLFTPQKGTLSSYTADHLKDFDPVYTFGFSLAAKNLAAIATERRNHALRIGSGMVAGLLLTIAAAFVIIRSTRRDLAAVSTHIETASNDVEAASAQLNMAGERMSNDASSYAAAIEEIGSSLNELASGAEESRKHAENAAASTARARTSVDSGLGTIQDLDTAMNSARISGQKIVQIIARINDISFQTNLLALNAAVEAARAGSAGAGFAVVADEVRRLAHRCAEEAKETEQLIGESTKDTNSAIAKSDELAKSFKTVSSGIHEINEIVSLITGNISQQAVGLAEINNAVERQGQIAQSIAAAAEETASTAFSMHDQVGSLKQTVGSLEALLGKLKSVDEAAAPPAEMEPAGTPEISPASSNTLA